MSEFDSPLKKWRAGEWPSEEELNSLFAEVERLRSLKLIESVTYKREREAKIESLQSQLDEEQSQHGLTQYREEKLKEILTRVGKQRNELKEKLAICNEVDDETQTMIEGADKLIVENGDLTQENAELKTKLIVFADSNALINEENTKLKERMREISKLGRVCPEFEICKHESCADSCGAVLIALEALK